jgi:hypothetical protein
MVAQDMANYADGFVSLTRLDEGPSLFTILL